MKFFYNRELTIGITLVILIFFGCLTAGTHGSIKSYDFPVKKTVLENLFDSVIHVSKAVRRDTVRNYSIDVTNGKNDTVENNYYNDGTRYLTILIDKGEGPYQYILQYAGSNEYWDTSNVSHLADADAMTRFDPMYVIW